MVKTWHVLFIILCFQKVSNAADDIETTSAATINQPDIYTTCNRGWFPFGDMCYRMGGKKKIGRLSWEKASERCHEEHNGNLVSIHSKELLDFLIAFLLMSVRETVWIGLHDRVNESDYIWDDGCPVNFTNWEPGEPSGVSNEKEDCAEFLIQSGRADGKTGQWNDVECGAEKQFICQREKGKSGKKNLDPRFCSLELGGGWSHDTSCFHFVPEKKTWSEAEKYCSETFRGHLATIPDFPVNIFLNYVLRNQEDDLWIGIKIKEERQQQWTSGWYVSYENWSEDEEEFSEGSCAARNNNGKWNRMSCNKLLSFVCEYSTASPPVLKLTAKGTFCPALPADWRDLGGNYCYYFNTKDWVTWYEANFLCMRRGGTLLSIHSQEEIDIMSNFVKFTQNTIFIGLYRHLQYDEEFVWADGSPVNFTVWDSNEPNTEKEKCAEIRTYNMKWNDVDCTNLKGYICSVLKVSPNQTSDHQSHPPPCLSGFSGSTLLGVIFCVLFFSALLGVVIYYFRLCERGYERVRKTSGTKLQSPSAFDKKPRYRSEIVVTDDNDAYENMA